MGKGVGKIAFDLIKVTSINPLFKLLKEEKKAEDKRYDKWLNEMDRLSEAQERFGKQRTHEVHQMYDSSIHQNDFW
jgi:hypothetical protein